MYYLCFLLRLLWFRSYVQVSNPSWVNFCVCCQIAECQRIDAFELWCWIRLLRIPWTTRRSNQSILRKSVLNIHWKDWSLGAAVHGVSKSWTRLSDWTELSESVPVVFFVCGSLIFSTLFIKQTAFSSLYILPSSQINWLYMWVYFWALYSVLMIYISEFILVAFCFNYIIVL